LEVQLHTFLTSALDGGEWSASSPEERCPQHPLYRKAVWAPEPVWNRAVENRNNPCQDVNPAVQSVA